MYKEFSLEKEAPVTQTVEAIAVMLNFLKKPSNPLPEIVPLANGSQLVKSTKGDCYYVTSLESCTCPGFHYHRICKHIRNLNSTQGNIRGHAEAEAAVEESRQQARRYRAKQREVMQKAKNGSLEPVDSIRPVGGRVATTALWTSRRWREMVDVYEKITSKIIELLETGTVPWRQPWSGAVPTNLSSMKPYNGINLI